ncbi:hypothetical protein M758_1G292000 [Ceratodon purpureus]|nr:hypothetical protein M758_1G292000 [Ceratodon purpureus]
MERDNVERGKEKWFASTVSLPNYGLDPSRDVNHVQNSELIQMFGARQQNLGYFYPGAKSERIKSRVEELYPAIYQFSEMPKNQCIKESFARAILSEVCHGYPMNWAQYAAERWSTCKNLDLKSETVIRYVGAESLKETYYEVAKSKFEGEIEDSRVAYSTADQDYTNTRVFIKSIMTSPKHPSEGAERDGLLERLSVLKIQLQEAEEVLEKCKKKTEIGSSSETISKKIGERMEKEKRRVIKLKYEIKQKEIALIDSKGEIFEALNELDRLQTLMANLIGEQDRLKGVLKMMKERNRLPMTLRPSQHVVEEIESHDSDLITIIPCPLCNGRFMHMEIIVAPCKCTYHPWCMVMQSWMENRCAKKECGTAFTDNWKRSVGLDKMPVITEEATVADCSTPERKRRFLNSDIGGTSYARKPRKEA